MKTVDLTSLKANDTEYEELIRTVAEKYECEWNDEVHDSYELYIRQIQEYSRTIHMIRCKAEVIVEEIEDLNYDEMIHTAESLCEVSATV